MQRSQKVGQKKWSHNSSQKTYRTSTPTPSLLKGLLSTAFMDIKDRMNGISKAKEKDVRIIMRNEMKKTSFIMWRKRVNGRKTKHLKTSSSFRFKSTNQKFF